jgi:hypothetical protein
VVPRGNQVRRTGGISETADSSKKMAPDRPHMPGMMAHAGQLGDHDRHPLVLGISSRSQLRQVLPRDPATTPSANRWPVECAAARD